LNAFVIQTKLLWQNANQRTPQTKQMVRYKAAAPMSRVGQNRIYTPCTTVHLVISLPEMPYVHRIYTVLANPTKARINESVKQKQQRWLFLINQSGDRSLPPFCPVSFCFFPTSSPPFCPVSFCVFPSSSPYFCPASFCAFPSSSCLVFLLRACLLVPAQRTVPTQSLPCLSTQS